MRYAPCLYCGSVTSFEMGDPICGTCEIMIDNAEQRELELDQQIHHMEDLERSMQEENDCWELDANVNETDIFQDEVRQQMEEDDQRLFTNRMRGDFRRVYMDSEQEGQLVEQEEEFYENDQDDFDFDMSYQDNIEAIRNDLSARQFDVAHDRSAIVQRLLRIFVNEAEEGIIPDDASQAKGASESDISILSKRTLDIHDPDANTECAICTEKFEHLELTKLPCIHEYHSECIQHWLKLNASCPICRQSIVSTKLESDPQSQPQPQQQQEEEPDIIIIRRETANRIRQNNVPLSFLDDID